MNDSDADGEIGHRTLALPPQWFQEPYLVGNEPMIDMLVGLGDKRRRCDSVAAE